MKRWPLHNPFFWETAPFFRPLLALVAGICWYYSYRSLAVPGGICCLVAFGLFLLFCGIAFSRRAKIGSVLPFILTQLFVLSCGYSLAYFSDDRNASNWFGNNTGAHVTNLVTISGEPVAKENSRKIPVNIIGSIDNGKPIIVSGKAFLYLYKDRLPVSLHSGDTLLVPGKWQPIRNAGNPFEFDYATYCRRNNIYFQQSCSPPDIRLYAANDPGHLSFIDRSHNYCMAQLDNYLPDPKARGLIQAMILGDEVNLDEDLRQSYSETGIVHIIAISGGNVTIFFVVISFLLRWLKNKKHLWISYALAFPLVWFYVIMAGAQPSAIRAAVTFSLLAFAVIFDKNNNSLNLLFATAFILLLFDPAWLFALGFQLSLVAVLSIILFYKPIYRRYTPKYKVVKKLWSAIAISIAAEILVAPLVIYYFHTFPLLFLPANVAAFLFMGLVLILGIIIIAIPIAFVGKGIGIATVYLVTWFDYIVDHLRSYNPPSFRYLMLTGPELAVLYCCIAGLLYFLLHKKKPALFTALSATCVLIILFCSDQWGALHQQRLVVYNTGKTNHIELITGKTFSVLATDTLYGRKTTYTVKPAHTAWYAWREGARPAQQVYRVGNKTVAIINDSIAFTGPFGIDYLILNTHYTPDLTMIKQTFDPRMIVIGNNYPRPVREELLKSAAAIGLPAYSVADKGAFIFSAAQ
jgi:competence protein ComEC